MRIDVIDTMAAFNGIRENWDRLYLNDPHAQHFLSWIWLREYFTRRNRWFILALRERDAGSPYVAFFPLRVVTYQDKQTGHFSDEIIMGGNYAADYTGFIADPAYERHAIAGFAAYLRQQHWTHLKLDYFSGSPQRQQGMIQALRGPDVMHRDSAVQNKQNIDNCICPSVALPATWDDYLEQKMSSSSRQKLRRFLRKVEGDEAYRITFATRETIVRDMDILFSLWRTKWLSTKGTRIDRLIASSREMLMDCFNDGNLDLPVLWYNDQPLGALANIVDRQKMAILFYITGRDETWTTPSPGLILHGHCIRRAIADGFRTYDFLRGNEPYKYMFGVDEHRLSCTLFRTRTGRNLGDRLNARSIRYVYERGKDFYHKGNKNHAEIAFRQVCTAAPEHLGAQFGLANILFDKGQLREAEAAYRLIAGRAEDPVPVLLKLGDAQLALTKYGEAVDTFAEIVRQAPHNSQGHYKYGIALIAEKRLTDAAAAFAVLETYSSDDPSHAAYRKKANDAVSRLVPAGGPEIDVAGRQPFALPSEIIVVPPQGRKKGLRSSAAIQSKYLG